MNIDHIIKQIAYIKQLASYDDEAAHSMEDDLYESFIVAVAQNTYDGNLQEAAKLVLSTKYIEFQRWCA